MTESKGDRPWDYEPMKWGTKAGRARWEARLSVQLLDAASPKQAADKDIGLTS